MQETVVYYMMIWGRSLGKLNTRRNDDVRGRGPKVLRGMRGLAAREAQEKGEPEWPCRGHLEPGWAGSGSLLSSVCRLRTVGTDTWSTTGAEFSGGDDLEGKRGRTVWPFGVGAREPLTLCSYLDGKRLGRFRRCQRPACHLSLGPPVPARLLSADLSEASPAPEGSSCGRPQDPAGLEMSLAEIWPWDPQVGGP